MSLNFLSALPAERQPAVNQALADTFGKATVTDVDLLTSGLSGAPTYRIVVNNKAYVLKLTTSGESQSAFTNNSIAAAAGVAPALHYHNNLNGITISDFISNVPLRAVFAGDKLTTELAATVKAIHLLPGGMAGPDLFVTIDGLITQFKQIGILVGPVFHECFAYYERLKTCYPQNDTDKVFSHNDLNPGNILCDGRKIWIIDWDAAYLNNRYIDLANIANFFVHTDEQEELYLNHYFDGRVTEKNKAQFFVMRQMCRMIYAMLMFQLAARGKPAEYAHNQQMDGFSLPEVFALIGAGNISLATYDGQLMYGKALLNMALSQMQSPRWANALSQFK